MFCWTRLASRLMISRILCIPCPMCKLNTEVYFQLAFIFLFLLMRTDHLLFAATRGAPPPYQWVSFHQSFWKRCGNVLSFFFPSNREDALFMCSRPNLLCSPGGNPDGAVHEVWGHFGDVLEPWWGDYTQHSACPPDAEAAGKCLQLHVLLLREAFLVASRRPLYILAVLI